MKLLVISSAPIVELDGKLHLYAPYEKEMQLWAKHADTIQFCCPIWREDKKLLIAPISFKVDAVVALQEFDITSFSNKLKAIPLAFVALVKIFKAMKQADHIHLRCPGNIALLACLVQILFPNKQKTAKYAGNWDPKSKQPWSYRLQKWILSNTFLTRNMQVLVYGEWEGSTKNIKSFFTATYSESEIQNSEFRIQNKWSFQSESITTESDFDFAQSDKKDNNSLSLQAQSITNENNSDFPKSDKEENTSLSLRAESGTNENNFDSAQSDKEDITSLSLRAESGTNENNFDSAQSDKPGDSALSLRAQSRTNKNNFDFTQSDKEDNTSLSLRAQSRTNENNFDFAQSDKKDNNSLSLRAKSRTNENNSDFPQFDKEDNTLLSLRAESRTNENQFKFLFIGTLSPGKQPLYAIQLVEELYKKGRKVTLELYGEGVLRKELELYIAQNKLEPIITLKGNHSRETVLKAYQTSHFLILPSKSEGWPKVVAEAMFWGCVPIASPVSCVSFMMGNGSRGIVLKEQLHNDVSQIRNVLNNQEVYKKMALDGQTWSRQFTTDKFEAEIKKLLRG